jgi:uncharacterized glyoxalase superfamily protein PhnB
MITNRFCTESNSGTHPRLRDVEKAIDWLCVTFGFAERLRAARPGDNVTHAQLTIGEGAVMLGRQGGEFRPPRPNKVSQYVTVHVADVNGISSIPVNVPPES